jgi:hypothetical protein
MRENRADAERFSHGGTAYLYKKSRNYTREAEVLFMIDAGERPGASMKKIFRTRNVFLVLAISLAVWMGGKPTPPRLLPPSVFFGSP